MEKDRFMTLARSESWDNLVDRDTTLLKKRKYSEIESMDLLQN